MGFVLARASTHMMRGEIHELRFHRRLLLTLAATSTTIVSNHLLVFWLGWIGISFGLHHLLLFYPDRPRAALAAHKKFLCARMAEFSLLIAFSLLYAVHGTWFIDQILPQVSERYEAGMLDWQSQTAAVFIALAALIKCAQMPLHGWLMQVVEAPTPVSALLHAGVINLGGFLLMLFAPLIMAVDEARYLLILVAAPSMVIASLVMTTRISIKVRLAWSTCAQMGLMLVECALGLYDLALLHLFAHSIYKAHAFLNAGSTVEHDVLKRMSPLPHFQVDRWAIAFGFALGMVVMVGGVIGYGNSALPWLLLTFALTLIIARHTQMGMGLLLGIGVMAVYLIQKKLFGLTMPNGESMGPIAEIWVLCWVLALGVGYLVIHFLPESDWVKQWKVKLFSGLYLDEWATRLTLKIWPTSMPAIHQQRLKSLRGEAS
jgi:NAD(P)H-quinone oxidoreductase subunit 5